MLRFTNVRILPKALLLSFPILLGACTDTLVFSERTGFNLSVRVANEPTTPVEINAGLDRSIITFAPPVGGTEDAAPAGQRQSANERPVGDAVSIFSGFRLTDNPRTPGQELGATKLRVRTQFASGKAAIFLADEPKAVAKITNVSIAREAGEADDAVQKRIDKLLDGIDKLLDGIDKLGDDEAKDLAEKPPVDDAVAKKVVDLRDPTGRRKTDPKVARAMLKTYVVLAKRNERNLTAWEAAVQAEQ